MDTLDRIAAQINEAYAAGKTVTVNGNRVKSWGKTPAKVWGTGSMSVDIPTKRGNKTTPIWYKPGQVLPTIEITD